MEREQMMNHKVRWGVLGAAKIAVEKVIPAMQQGDAAEISAIASRDLARARKTADALGIAKAYGSYEELLADEEIDAIYNPLPNHMHVPWTIKAAEAGKHVLCEKPIAMSVAEVRTLIAARDRTRVHIQEAFMVRAHTQWTATRALIASERIGELRAVTGFFSYFNRDPANIRNRLETGGGALMDIGCYPINIARFIFNAEPRRCFGLVERDPEMGVDRLTSAMLDFANGQATFTCSTQLVPYQRIQLFGTRGRIEVEIPFNAPPDRATRILIDDGSDLSGGGIETQEFPACNQYTVQGDLFSRAVRGETTQAIPLEDSLHNMAIIEAVFRSSESGQWEMPTVSA